MFVPEDAFFDEPIETRGMKNLQPGDIVLNDTGRRRLFIGEVGVYAIRFYTSTKGSDGLYSVKLNYKTVWTDIKPYLTHGGPVLKTGYYAYTSRFKVSKVVGSVDIEEREDLVDGINVQIPYEGFVCMKAKLGNRIPRIGLKKIHENVRRKKHLVIRRKGMPDLFWIDPLLDSHPAYYFLPDELDLQQLILSDEKLPLEYAPILPEKDPESFQGPETEFFQLQLI